jgi:hypothetical protein
MNKLIIFILILIIFPKSIFAQDISNYQIEGINIGDNLLDFMSKDDVLKKIESSKDDYYYLKEPNKYAEVYYYKNLKTYDYLSFFIESPSSSKFLTKKNEKYTVISLRGGINFINDLEGCLKKRDELEKDVDYIFQNTRKDKYTSKHPLDPSGKSMSTSISYMLQNGDTVILSCNDWEENFRKQNDFSEGLSLNLFPKELGDWFRNSN